MITNLLLGFTIIFHKLNMPKSNTRRSKSSLSNLLRPDKNDQEIIRLTRENASLRDQLQNRQDHMDRMYEDIMRLAELLEFEQQRVQQLQEEVAQLKKT